MSEKQRTVEWFAERLGIPTASRISEIMPDSKKDLLSVAAKSYLMELIAERLTGLPKVVKGAALDWGTMYESHAIVEYTQKTKNKVMGCGFIKKNNCGGSPDGLLDNKGIIEVKCPYNTANHILNIIDTEKVIKDYSVQIQSNIWLTDSQYCEFISYDNRIDDENLRLFVKKINRDDNYINLIISKLSVFNAELERIYFEIAGTTEWEVDEGKLYNFLVENNMITTELEF